MSSLVCPTKEALVDERIDRVLTQYRESPRLLFLIKAYLNKVAETALQVCDLPEKFDLDTAVGDQLTILGKRLGWPRCHCICDVQPVFGFEYDDEISLRPVTGFGGTLPTASFGFCDDNAGFAESRPVSWDGCETPDLSEAATNSTWANCATGLSELCLSSDSIYRKFLKVRIYQMLGHFDLTNLETCLRIFFGDKAKVMHAGQGRVVIAPGRTLTDTEITLLQLYPRVLPIALGIEVRFHFGETRVFGFGDGWGGFLEEDNITTEATESYKKTGKVFGFCDDQGGFCEPWLPDGLPLFTEDGDEITDGLGASIKTGSLTEDATWMCRVGAPWMCETDVRPYDCA